MKKLFLASKGVPDDMQQQFAGLVGKPLNDIRVAHIIDAADTYPEAKRSFVEEQRDNFRSLGVLFDDIRVSETDDLEKILSAYDVVWFGGGNSWYLRYVIRKYGLETIIPKLLDGGIVYAGGSAGAVVATPSLKHFDLADNPDDSPEMIEEGLGLTNFEIIPHWGNEKYAHILGNIKSRLESDGFEVRTLNDDQAVIAGEE